jgi:membrane-associated phospholipid phosphatase
MAAGVLLLAFAVVLTAAASLRAWLPHLYLVAGYWIPALLVPTTRGRRFEEWLLKSDVGLRRLLPGVPAPFATIVELAYLSCYPLVPVAFAVVWVNGSSVDAERFWLAVLLAGYSCYATLPLLVSRPPRSLLVDVRLSRGVVAGMNASVLGRVSHELNTFPSGHVAVAAAAAASAATVSPPAGVVLAVVVAAICVGAAAGRYHYVVDVVLGLAVAVAAHVAAAAV